MKDLIKRILVPPSNRLTLRNILEHPWLGSLPASQKISLNVTQLNKYKNYSRVIWDKFRQRNLQQI